MVSTLIDVSLQANVTLEAEAGSPVPDLACEPASGSSSGPSMEAIGVVGAVAAALTLVPWHLIFPTPLHPPHTPRHNRDASQREAVAEACLGGAVAASCERDGEDPGGGARGVEALGAATGEWVATFGARLAFRVLARAAGEDGCDTREEQGRREGCSGVSARATRSGVESLTEVKLPREDGKRTLLAALWARACGGEGGSRAPPGLHLVSSRGEGVGERRGGEAQEGGEVWRVLKLFPAVPPLRVWMEWDARLGRGAASKRARRGVAAGEIHSLVSEGRVG
ncbi:hypothetical protein T484DRAFT_1771673, partial [Baffinella frigidus]